MDKQDPTRGRGVKCEQLKGSMSYVGHPTEAY